MGYVAGSCSYLTQIIDLVSERGLLSFSVSHTGRVLAFNRRACSQTVRHQDSGDPKSLGESTKIYQGSRFSQPGP